MKKRLLIPFPQSESLVEPPIGDILPFPPNFAFPFLLLPIELRFKIYRSLFRTTIPVCPATTPRDKYHKLASLERPSFPIAVFLVCKQISDEASSIFWADNEIVLRFPLDWPQQYGRRCCETRRPYECFIPPAHSLSKIQKLTLEVFLFRQPNTKTAATQLAKPGMRVKRQLAELCSGLNAGHMLKNVVIRFTNRIPAHSPHEVTPGWEFMHRSEFLAQKHRFSDFLQPELRHGSCLCITGYGYGFGMSGLNDDELESLCKQAIDTDQQVLRALTELSGVKNVQVIGSVTKEWADYVKICMERKTQEMPPAFQSESSVAAVPARGSTPDVDFGVELVAE